MFSAITCLDLQLELVSVLSVKLPVQHNEVVFVESKHFGVASTQRSHSDVILTVQTRVLVLDADINEVFSDRRILLNVYCLLGKVVIKIN